VDEWLVPDTRLATASAVITNTVGGRAVHPPYTPRHRLHRDHEDSGRQAAQAPCTMRFSSAVWVFAHSVSVYHVHTRRINPVRFPAGIAGCLTLKPL